MLEFYSTKVVRSTEEWIRDRNLESLHNKEESCSLGDADGDERFLVRLY